MQSANKKKIYLEPIILKCIELWPMYPWWFAVHIGDDSVYPVIIVRDYFIPALNMNQSGWLMECQNLSHQFLRHQFIDCHGCFQKKGYPKMDGL